MKNNVFYLAIGTGCLITVVIITVAGFLSVNNKFPDYKSSVLAQHVDYFEEQHVNALYSRAEEKFDKNKDYNGALENLEKNYEILKIVKSENKDLLNQRKKDILCLKKLIDLNKKIEKEPKNIKLRLERGDIMGHFRHSMFIDKDELFCSDLELAYNDYNTALNINPDLKEIYEKRADIRSWSMEGVSYPAPETEKQEHIFKEKLKMNLSDYKKAMELNGKTPELLMKLASTYNNLEHPEKAVPLFEEAALSGNIYAYYGLVISYAKLNEPEKVIEYVDKFLGQAGSCNGENSCYRYLHYTRGKANLKLHKFKEAYKDWKNSGYIIF